MYVLTNDSLQVRSLQCSQAEVSDLHQPCHAIDEHIVTLEIAMNDWRSTVVEKIQSLQNLSAPTTYRLVLDRFQTSHVTEEDRKGGRKREREREEGRRMGEKEEGREGEKVRLARMISQTQSVILSHYRSLRENIIKQ